MFTGIIEELGHVRHLGGGSLVVEAHKVVSDAQIGDSIAVNGVCLTVTSFTPSSFTADVMPETVRRTSFRNLRAGSPLNLERALAVGSRLGGHIVSGHIDGCGTLRDIREEGNAVIFRVGAAPVILQGIVEKGSVALDGISLTVASVSDQDFTVSIIPHSRLVTNLGSKRVGDPINIENDVIGKYVAKMMSLDGFQSSPYGMGAGKKEGTLTRDFLLEHGF